MSSFFYKLLLFFCCLCVAVSVPIISAGITFGSPIYRPFGTPIYYERPYNYYHDDYYYDGSSRYPYDYSPNYEYVSGGLGGFHGTIENPHLLVGKQMYGVGYRDMITELPEVDND